MSVFDWSENQETFPKTPKVKSPSVVKVVQENTQHKERET